MVFCVKTDVKNSLVFAALASWSVNALLACWSQSAPTSFLTVFLLFSFLLSLFSRHTYFFCSSLIFLFTFELPCFMGALFPLLGNLLQSFPFLILLGHTQFSLHDFLMFLLVGLGVQTTCRMGWPFGFFNNHVTFLRPHTFYIVVLNPHWSVCYTSTSSVQLLDSLGSLCRATHSPGSIAAQKTETGIAWIPQSETCEILTIFDGSLS